MRRLAFLLALVLLGSGLTACGGGGGTSVTAEFRDAAGLFVGNDVGVLGVRVGEVKKIDPAGPKVLVTLEIDPGVKVPANASAVIVSRSVATDRYVELTPVYDKGAVLASGATIGVAKTHNPVEFDKLLGSVDELANSVAGPNKDSSALSDLLSVGARTLDGNGTRIAGTVSDLAAALEAVNGGSGDAASVLKNLDTLTRALARNDKTVRDFSDNVTSATGMLNDEHLLMQQTFDALSSMLTKVAVFARDHRAEIGDQLDNITSISRTLLSHQKQLAETLEVLPLMMQNVDRAIDDHNRLTIKVRPGDLIPGKTAAEALCNETPTGFCAGFDFSSIPIFEFFNALAGVKK